MRGKKKKGRFARNRNMTGRERTSGALNDFENPSMGKSHSVRRFKMITHELFVRKKNICFCLFYRKQKIDFDRSFGHHSSVTHCILSVCIIRHQWRYFSFASTATSYYAEQTFNGKNQWNFPRKGRSLIFKFECSFLFFTEKVRNTVSIIILSLLLLLLI